MRHSHGTVVVMIALTILSGCAKPVNRRSYSPVMPSVGDQATVAIKQVKSERRQLCDRNPGYIMRGSDYLYYRVVIRCVQANGERCRLNVYHQVRNVLKGPIYLVSLDYHSDNMDKRTVVRDMAGRVVARCQKIDGFPIPFHDFLAFDHSYLASSTSWRKQTLSGHLTADIVGREGDSQGVWFVSTDIYPSGYHRKRICRERQWWKSGNWLWTKNYHSGKDGDWEATIVDSTHKQK